MDPRSPATPKPTRTPGARIVLGVLATLAVLVALAIALFGAWVGTSLAVYRDGPVWLVIVGAIACFFVVPLLWELWADRHQRGGRIRDAILRSAFLSLTFLVVLLATHPKLAFQALATRGDWFLGGATDTTANDVRRFLHSAANGLEWLNDFVRDKAFRLDDDDPDAVAARRADPRPSPSGKEVTLRVAGTDLAWPLPGEVHPAVAAMPADAKRSVASVGAYLKGAEPDALMRIKAIHDFVATWVAYDAQGLVQGTYTFAGQQPDVVFAERKAVCEGYARLVSALARETGDEVVVVTGDSRRASDYEELAASDLPAEGVGHAWNAARVGDQWVLLDATWNAGHVRGEHFTAEYKTDFLFTPAEVMIHTHRPDDDRFQLLAAPLDRGDWLRQPLLRPLAYRLGVTLLDPRHPIVEASGELVVRFDNPHRNWLALKLVPLDGGDPLARSCSHDNGAVALLRCNIPSDGRMRAVVFGSTEQYALAWGLAEMIVDGRAE